MSVILSRKLFSSSWGKKFFILGLKFRFTCGESKLDSIIFVYSIVGWKVPKYYDQDYGLFVDILVWNYVWSTRLVLVPWSVFVKTGLHNWCKINNQSCDETFCFDSKAWIYKNIPHCYVFMAQASFYFFLWSLMYIRLCSGKQVKHFLNSFWENELFWLNFFWRRGEGGRCVKLMHIRTNSSVVSAKTNGKGVNHSGNLREQITWMVHHNTKL